MNAATAPLEIRDTARLLYVTLPTGALQDHAVAKLPRLLRAGDLLVVNDAATLPASLQARTTGGAALELRLAGESDDGTWTAVVFGGGDWRLRTEDRGPAPDLRAGTLLAFGPGLAARVVRVSSLSPRLVSVCFDQEGAPLWTALYRFGRPVQYSYLSAPVALWDVQTAWATRPWAVEPPSAGLPLTAASWRGLRDAGIAVAAVTHAAGLSSTGDLAIDAALPLPERYDVPQATVDAVRTTRARRGRVIAVGTTVVRALEAAAAEGGGTLAAGVGRTALRLHAAYRPRIVDGLLTGIHQPGESHFDLLRAFASEGVLHDALAHASRTGYLTHEFGDTMLLLPGADAASR
jgi:S-adenosylmethionine:tRNA ribosyltransferase-isomerase